MDVVGENACEQSALLQIRRKGFSVLAMSMYKVVSFTIPSLPILYMNSHESKAILLCTYFLLLFFSSSLMSRQIFWVKRRVKIKCNLDANVISFFYFF